MHTERVFKHLSNILLIVLLPLLLWMSLQASISGDEFLHRDQAESVVDYFLSLGKNQKALDTPITNLKHYGQSVDNLASLIARIFKFEDIFILRHFISAMAGWLVMMVAFLMAQKTGGWQTAFFTLLILAVSPGFMGHTLNNLKDIPFALGYMAGIYFILKWINSYPQPKLKTAWWLVASIAFSISIRPPGLILIAYLGLAVVLVTAFENKNNVCDSKIIIILLAKTLLVMVAGYFAGLLLWPFAIQNPFINPIISHLMMEAYPVTIRQLFMGEMIWSDLLPWYYLPWMITISVPLILFPGLISVAALYRFKKSQRVVLFLLFSILFPLMFIILKQSNVYGGWRHLLFIYPPLAILSGYGLMLLYKFLESKLQKYIHLVFLAFILLMVAEPISFMVRNHPFHYLYFNPITGGYKGAFAKYEADYYFNTIQSAAQWLNNHLKQSGEKRVKVVSNFESAWHFRNNQQVTSVSQTSWYNRNHYEWDYAIFSATYMHAHTLKTGLWPPPGTIHTVTVDGVPVCAVIKRTTNQDYNGWKALENGHFKEAIVTLDSCVQKDPSIEGAWLDYGRALYQSGKYDQAIEKLNQALTLHPFFEPALLVKAHCNVKKGNVEEALAITSFLLKKNVKYLPAWMLRSEILVESGRKEEAIETLIKALEIQPSFKEIRNKLLELTKQ